MKTSSKRGGGKGTRVRGSRDGGCSGASRGEAKAASRSRNWAPDTVFHVAVRENGRITRKTLACFATGRLAHLTVEGQGLLKGRSKYFMRGCRGLRKLPNATDFDNHERLTFK